MFWFKFSFNKLITTPINHGRLSLLHNSAHMCGAKKPPWNVLFFGADQFSIFSLKALTHEYRKGHLIKKLEVVTTIKGKPNPVKVYSDFENLVTHKWKPEISNIEYDVGLVVSFGHLIPEHIINKFKYGILNVHASLLPRWRGAAPIIYALANGDNQTGVTIMRINAKKFDVGEIVAQSSLEINQETRMMELYTQLGALGAETLINVLENLATKLENSTAQPTEGVCYAPKVDSSFAQINWTEMSAERIYNLSRALDGVYALQTTWRNVRFKFPQIKLGEIDGNERFGPGYVYFDKSMQCLKILCSDCRFIIVETLAIVGKKTFSAKDFNNGFLKKEPIECRYFR